MAKPYSLFKRATTKKNKFIYYAHFRDADTGKRLTAVSSGQQSKSAAETWCIKQLKKGSYKPKSNMTFAKFSEKWWVWDECAYINRKIQRGGTISKAHAENNVRNLNKHLLPYFGEIKLSKISTSLIENFLLELSHTKNQTGNPLSNKTLNNILGTLRVMINEAYRLELFDRNPIAKIGQYKANSQVRGILNLDEAKLLFNDNRVEDNWYNLAHFTLNFLSASTGMRMGECQGLKIKYIHKDYVEVKHSWARKFGLKAPKNNHFRDIPILPKVSTYLQELIDIHPNREDKDAFIFWGRDGYTPIDNKTIAEKYYTALLKIGISEIERRKRNISFHSHRHFLNSTLRNKNLSDAKLRLLMGHITPDMTDNYTHFDKDSYRDIIEIQGEVFE